MKPRWWWWTHSLKNPSMGAKTDGQTEKTETSIPFAKLALAEKYSDPIGIVTRSKNPSNPSHFLKTDGFFDGTEKTERVFQGIGGQGKFSNRSVFA
jgi:hypothetical protein